jgi:hypothetical protein
MPLTQPRRRGRSLHETGFKSTVFLRLIREPTDSCRSSGSLKGHSCRPIFRDPHVSGLIRARRFGLDLRCHLHGSSVMLSGTVSSPTCESMPVYANFRAT